ncbi:4-hydroxybenzoate octaprenyltransferase [Endozoicomonadaceae bacterium StTr2]
MSAADKPTLQQPDWQTRFQDFVQLTRLNRPIGILLLLWPTWWALWLAAEGMPDISVLLIFTAGVVLMRSAGCVVNDFADRNFDGHVKRTAQRPMPSGRVSTREALVLFTVLVTISFVLVLMTNILTIMLSVGGVLLASIYPFMKRYTHLPQVVLGAAFGWSIPMAYAAQSGDLPTTAWLLFIANLLWTVAYDTQYAMVDRDDDLKIGIKSTAILFGDLDNVINLSLQGLFLICMVMLGVQLESGILYYLGLAGALVLFAYQYRLTRNRERMPCFTAFLNNNWVGCIVFAGIALDQMMV